MMNVGIVDDVVIETGQTEEDYGIVMLAVAAEVVELEIVTVVSVYHVQVTMEFLLSTPHYCSKVVSSDPSH